MNNVIEMPGSVDLVRRFVPAKASQTNCVSIGSGTVPGIIVSNVEARPIRTSGRPNRDILFFSSDVTAGSSGTVTLDHDSYSKAYGLLISDGTIIEQMPAVRIVGIGGGSSRWSKLFLALSGKLSGILNAEPTTTPRLRVDRLAYIQGALGLQMQELAQVLMISRPNLYKWLDPAKEITLQGAKRERLALIERVANAWSKESTSPFGAIARETLSNGKTLIDLLSVPDVDEHEMISAIREAATKKRVTQLSASQKMAKAGFARRKARYSFADDE